MISVGAIELKGEASRTPIDQVALRRYRLARLQAELRRAGIAAAYYSDPVNIRYATGTRNMQVWLLHNPGRYCIVPADGLPILFEFSNRNCMTWQRGNECVGEVRPAIMAGYLYSGEAFEEHTRQWARQIADVAREFGCGNALFGIDRCDPVGFAALQAEGLRLADSQAPIEKARAMKSKEEIACMAEAIAAAEVGVSRMREALRPGLTENELWSELHRANIALGGEWIETRMLTAGAKTNPWYQEAGDNVIQSGDLVAFDTDLVGPHGYCADMSRTFHCGPQTPTARQKDIYALALEQIRHNCDMLKPGMSFDEMRAQAWRIPDRFYEQHYGMIAHGVGLIDEWPYISTDASDPLRQNDVLQPGMTICIESYIGEVDGPDGVKLEEQVLITETGWRALTSFPMEETLR